MSRSVNISAWICHSSWSLLLCLASLLAESAVAAPNPRDALPSRAVTLLLDTLKGNSRIRLPDQFIVPGSDTLRLASGRMLKRGIDYSIEYRFGTMSFDSLFLHAMQHDTLRQYARCVLEYRFFPFHFKGAYARRELISLKDSSGTDTLRVAAPKSILNVDEIFGSSIQKSGSLVRGFTVGSNRDLSLNSGLRLQLAGRVASDIEIVAALTDESTPIQPEGTTQTLQEFDKVFVEMRSTDVTATLGDFNLDFTGTEFARLSRKLQGAKGTADYRFGSSSGSVVLSGAVPRGKFNTLQLPGLEGVQGPYRLTGKNGERTIIVIAGTERVYINGEQQTRGETNDYTIDYSLAEVTFTPRRLVTSASRIVIDYEYTDRNYSRSLLAAQASSTFLDNRARLSFSYFREADDPDAPIDFAITDSARRVLQSAGSDRDKAVLSGVTPVDTNGTYVRVDTVLTDGKAAVFYRYAPGDPHARYVVTFSDVGSGRGEYVRQQLGIFVWKGPGGGDYLPLRYLPLPQSEQLMDLSVDFAPVSDVKINGEVARSVFDANRLSPLDQGDNAGHALKFSVAYAPRKISIGGMSLGSLDLLVKERYVNRRFVPVDRTNDIEFNRKWGIDSLSATDEEIQEGSLLYQPTPSVTIGTGYGKITRGDLLTSHRNDGLVTMKGEGLPRVNYSFEDVRTTDNLSDRASSWLRQKGSMEYAFGQFTPSFRYEGENRLLTTLSSAATSSGSFRYNVFAPGLHIRQLGNISLSTGFEWRADDSFLGGAVVRESRSFTQTYGGRLAEWNSLTASLDVTLRKKNYSQAFLQQGSTDVSTVLVRNQLRYVPLNRGVDVDAFYEVATERSSRLERVFVRVTQGSGNYKYLGDLNNNGVTDEQEFVLTRFDGDYVAVSLPSDQLYPVIDLKTSVRLRVTPRNFLRQPSDPLEQIASVVSTETYVRVEEKSRETDLKQIYLLHFSRFQQDSTTITGSTLLTQDVNFFEGDPLFSARLRYSQRSGLNRFSSGTERNYVRERSIRLRLQLVKEFSNQIDFVNRGDRVSASEGSPRLRDILSNDFVFDMSYRPEQAVEVGFKLENGTSTDRFQTPELGADLNTQSVRVVYALQGAGQARAEFSREEIRLGGTGQNVPFELTGGRVEGKTWLWRFALDYRITQFIQATMNYEGRSEGDRSPVHTARAEVRAFF